MPPPSYSWTLEPDAEPAPSPTPTAAEVAEAAAERGELSFLGFGLLRPFRRDEKQDFANGGGMRLLRARLGQILGTKADTVNGPGELPWRSNFGSRLHILRHRNNSDELVDLAAVIADEAITRWEKNVEVRDVEVIRFSGTGEGRRLRIRVHYQLIDPSAANAVAPDVVETTV